MKRTLEQVLEEERLVDTAGLRRAQVRRSKLGGSLEEHLLAEGALDEEALLRGLALQHRVSYFGQGTLRPLLDKGLAPMVPLAKARYYSVVPVRFADGLLVLATCDWRSPARLQELESTVGYRVRLVIAPRREIEAAIATLYQPDTSSRTHTAAAKAAASFSDTGVTTLTEAESTLPSTVEVQQQLARELRREMAPTSGVYHLTQDIIHQLQQTSQRAEQFQGDEVTEVDHEAMHEVGVATDYATVLDYDLADQIRQRHGPDSGQFGSTESFPAVPTLREQRDSVSVFRDSSKQIASSSDQTTDLRPPVAKSTSRVFEADETELLKPGSEAPAPEPFGNYLLLRHIKTGGMAEVFEAMARSMQGVERRVAIKRILPSFTASQEFVTMFVDEAKIMAQLSHKAIGQVYELGEVDGAYYIALEYVDGCDLNTLFYDAQDLGEPLPVPVAVYIMQQVYDGLDYAHRKVDFAGKSLGIVHRDVTPANILCSFGGDVKIIDFGIAKAVIKASLTRPGLIKGKISYMSPEQMLGRELDHRADLFSAAIVFWELLAGRRLFTAGSDIETIRNVLKADIPDILTVRADVPGDVAGVLHQALERNPERRPARASAVSEGLQRAIVRHGYRNPRGALAAYMESHFSRNGSDRDGAT